MSHTITDEQIKAVVKRINSMTADDFGPSILAELLPPEVTDAIIRALKDGRWKS